MKLHFLRMFSSLEFQELLTEEKLSGAPILVFANKQVTITGRILIKCWPDWSLSWSWSCWSKCWCCIAGPPRLCLFSAGGRGHGTPYNQGDWNPAENSVFSNPEWMRNTITNHPFNPYFYDIMIVIFRIVNGRSKLAVPPVGRGCVTAWNGSSTISRDRECEGNKQS